MYHFDNLLISDIYQLFYHVVNVNLCDIFQGPNSDTEELLKNEETASENGNVTSSSRDGKGKKKKKYLGRIQYKAITLSVCQVEEAK